jgi:predicted permease
MRAERPSGPPRLAERWLRSRLPERLVAAIAGDLEEEYRGRVLPRYGALVASLWYWVQVLRLPARELHRLDSRGGAAVLHVPSVRRSRGPLLRAADVRIATRRILHNPGFSAVAILSLALGIGANTAMFSVVNAVLLRELPVRDPDELVEVYTSESSGYAYSTSSYADFQDIRDGNDVFSGVVGTRTFIARTERGDRGEVAFGEVVSWDYFDVLGVSMALGRSFLPEEDATPSTHPVVILGYRKWMDEFGGSPTVLGQPIRLNGKPFTVVGVAPEEFSGSLPVVITGFYAPMMMTNDLLGSSSLDQLERRSSRSTLLKARLRPGGTIDQANAALAVIAARLEAEYPDSNAKRAFSALPAGDVVLHPLVDRALRPVAALLLAVVGLVLLIACTNLASFLLARAEDRRKEIALRLALGAGRRALVGQLLTETLLLAALGGVCGLLLAKWTLGALLAFRPPLPVPLNLDIPLDGTVLLFTSAVALITGIALGLAPAAQATNPELAPTLRGVGGNAKHPPRRSLRSGLVVSQVTLSFVLLIVAGLFVRSLQKAELVDPGFDVGPAALLWPMPDLSGYDTPEEQTVFYRLAEERLRADPRISAVALADRIPLGATLQTTTFVLPGVPSELPSGGHDIDNASVNVGYFDAMGVEIVAGRSFAESDQEGEPVLVVSEAFGDRFYPGQELVGRTIQDVAGNPLRIVGVARDTKVRTLGEAPRPYVYELRGDGALMGMQFIVRGRGSSEAILAAAREVFDAIDPDMVFFETKTMDAHLAIMLFPPRMAALLLGAFGGLALLLAGIGVYGVVSHSVASRTREMGIRMSLGASARDVVTMAVGGGMRLVLLGGAVGLCLAGGVTWALQGFLLGIGSTDVVTFVAIPLLLTSVAFVAALVPARRASRVDPVSSLRTE